MRASTLLMLATSTALVFWGSARVPLAAQQPTSSGAAVHWPASLWRASSIPRGERPLLVAMAMCDTAECVNAAYSRIRHPDLVARLVLYSNLARLDPSDREAGCHLLANLPKTGRAFGMLSSLGVPLYPDETYAEQVAVSDAYWQLNRRLAKALKCCPGNLPAFIRYGHLAIRDSHNDYPNWAVRVCRSNPSHFLEAFETLSLEDQHYIAKYVIEPKGCKQIAFPETE